MGSKLDSFLRERCFLLCFVHVVLLISLEIMRKIYISMFILQGRNTIFKNVLRVRCSLHKIKEHFTLIFRSVTRVSAVKYAMGSLWLLKLKVDVLTVQKTTRRRFQCCHSSEVLNLNNSLNIKIRTKVEIIFGS